MITRNQTKRKPTIVPFAIKLFNVPPLTSLQPGQPLSCQDSDNQMHEATFVEHKDGWTRCLVVQIQGFVFEKSRIAFDRDAILTEEFIVCDGTPRNSYRIKRPV